jgi:hypothetical protein
VDLPTSLFDGTTLVTLGGAAGATTIVAGALYQVTGVDRRYSGFAIALILMGVTVHMADQWKNPVAIVVAFVNACLIYLTAAGASGFIGGRGPGPAARGGRRPWFGSWF